MRKNTLLKNSNDLKSSFEAINLPQKAYLNQRI